MYRKRQSPAVINTNRFNTKTAEGIELQFRSYLQLFKPHRCEEGTENGLREPGQSWKDAFEEWKANAPEDSPFFKILQVREKIAKAEELIVKIQEEVRLHQEEEEDSESEEEIELEHPLNQSQIDFAQVHHVEKDELEKMVSQLNSDQSRVFNKVVRKLDHRKDKFLQRTESCSENCEDCLPIRMVVSGVGGTGKSFLIKTLCGKVTSMFPDCNPAVLTVAPTGLAAYSINGSTIHKMFCVRVQHGEEKPIENLRKEEMKLFKEFMKRVKLIIVDEFSMVSNITLCTIHLRLQQIFSEELNLGFLNYEDILPDEFASFGAKNIILFGDLLQLPPVNAQFCFEDFSPKNQTKVGTLTSENKLWKQFTYDELQENMRQRDDPEYAEMLADIRLGRIFRKTVEKLEERKVQVLEHSYAAWADYFCENVLPQDDKALALFPLTEDCDGFNAAMIKKLKIETVSIEAVDIRKGKQIVKKRINKGKKKKKASETAGLEEVLVLGVGAKVMLRRNLSSEDGLVNGSIGTVTELIIDSDCNIVMILVDFGKGPVAIARYCGDFEVSANVIGTRIQFPLCLSYGITVHKSQGLTLGSILVDLGSSIFSDAMAYVALSRVRKLESVHILRLDPTKFYCNEKAAREYSRLRHTAGLRELLHPNARDEEFKRVRKSAVPVNMRKKIRTSVADGFQEQRRQKNGPVSTNATVNVEKELVADQFLRFFNGYVGVKKKLANVCYANSLIQALLGLSQLKGVLQVR